MTTRTQKGTAERKNASERKSSLTYLRILEELAGSGITRLELSKAVGTAERTVQAWAAGTSTPTGTRAQRLLDVQLIVRLLSDAYSNEGVRIWLNSRNENLGLRRPLDLLEAGEIDLVLNEAASISGGM